MRQILLSKTILFIYFFPEVKIFRNIGVYNIILCVQNKPKDEKQILKRIIYKEIYQIKKVELIYQDELTEDIFKYETKRNDLVLLKSSNIVSLGDICYISVGMVLNSDEKKYKDLFKKKDLISSRKTNIHYKTYIENKYVDKFYPRKTAFLEFNTSRVPSKIRRATFIELYTNKKILVGKMGGRALFDDQGILCNDSMIVLVPYNNLIGVKNKILTRKNVKKAIEKGSLISKRYQLKYLLGIINSDFATNFFNSIRSHRQKNYVNPNELRQLPIFKASCDQQNLIIQTVELLEKNRKIKFSIDDLSMQESLDEEYKDLFKLLNKQIKSLYLNNDPITNE